MISRLSKVLLLCFLTVACSAGPAALDEASAKYKRNKDYPSLEAITATFTQGTPRKEVERLLGEPDYSPTEGQYYYSSNRSEHAKDQGRDVTVGLIVDYRTQDGKVTDSLQKFSLGPIGE